ncbi:hypothetical protein Saga11_06530 [Bacillus safensis]|nr:hypothetical protein Saga11_06530 [Bacillus safensis]
MERFMYERESNQQGSSLDFSKLQKMNTFVFYKVRQSAKMSFVLALCRFFVVNEI